MARSSRSDNPACTASTTSSGHRLSRRRPRALLPGRTSGRTLAGSSAQAAAALRRWYPRLDVEGTHHGYFEIGSPHSERVLEHISEHRPDILLVGMGTPQQELWVDRYCDRVEAGVVWTVGALFDYLSGRTPRAPHWISDHGFEWIFRLVVEPRRMWRRYLLGNPAFLHRVWGERRRARGPGR